MKTTVLIGIIILMLIPVSGLNAQTTTELIEEDYNNGTLSYLDYVKNLGYSAVARDRLPVKYSNARISNKCLFGIDMHIRAVYSELDTEHRELFKVLAFRPSNSRTPETYISPSGIFKIHYNITSIVDKVPDDDSNSNGVPDYVEEAGIAFDYSYDLLVNHMGYRPPPPDNGTDGDEYDIYILSMFYYGETLFEDFIMTEPVTRMTSYIQIDNNYTDSQFSTQDLDGLRVTAAHEFFHAIQGGSYIVNSNEYFFYEWTSTWFEDIAYDGIDDYIQYLDDTFREFDLPINRKNGWDEYGMCIWHHFAGKKFGNDIVRKIWENLGSEGALAAMREVFPAETGMTFDEALGDFYMWNMFTGEKADTLNYYTEGSIYPELTYSDTLIFESDTTITRDVGRLSAKYISVKRQQPTTFSIGYSIADSDLNKIFGTSVLTEPFVTEPVIADFTINSGTGSGSDFLTSFGSSPTLTVIPYVSHHLSRPNTLSYPIDLTFKFTGPVELNVNKLLQSIPSPANLNIVEQVRIPFVLVEQAEIELKIFSAVGKLVKSFERKNYGIGPNELIWDGRDNNNTPVPSGVYLYIINSPVLKDMKKMAIIR